MYKVEQDIVHDHQIKDVAAEYGFCDGKTHESAVNGGNRNDEHAAVFRRLKFKYLDDESREEGGDSEKITAPAIVCTVATMTSAEIDLE